MSLEIFAGITPETLGAVAAMAFAGTWSPGPNNAMLSASGARFGLRATLPHARGVALGFPAMVFAVALGLGEAFRHSELLRETLRWGGAALLGLFVEPRCVWTRGLGANHDGRLSMVT